MTLAGGSVDQQKGKDRGDRSLSWKMSGGFRGVDYSWLIVKKGSINNK